MTISADGTVIGKTSDDGVRLLGIPFGSVNFIENCLKTFENKRSIGADAEVGEYAGGKFIASNVYQSKKCVS